MKQIFNIFIFIALGLIITGCEKDTGVDIPAPKLIVLESSVLFGQEGGTGYIKVESDEAVTATTEQDWIDVSVSGKTITVTVGESYETGGRMGLVKIKSGGETVDMTVAQLSAVFRLDNIEDNKVIVRPEGGIRDIPFTSALPVTITPQDAWLNAEIVDNKYIRINLDPSTTIRSSKITATVTRDDGSLDTKEILVTQKLVAYADLIGDWDFTYKTTVGGAVQAAIKVGLSQKTANSTYTFGPFEIIDNFNNKLYGSFTATYDAVNQSLLMKGPEFVGYIAGESYPWVYMCFIQSATSLTTSTAVQMEGKISVENDRTITCTFVDNGTWNNTKAIGWGFFNFGNQELTGSIYSKKIFIDVEMTKRTKLTM